MASYYGRLVIGGQGFNICEGGLVKPCHAVDVPRRLAFGLVTFRCNERLIYIHLQ